MMRRIALRLVLAWCLVGSNVVSAGVTSTLKILSLNFNSEIVSFDDRKEIMRDMRFNAMVEFIKQQNPDIILIQEGWNYHGFPSVAIPLARAVGYDYHYRLVEGFPFFVYDSNVILAKKDFWMGARHKIKLPHSAPAIGDEIHTIIPFGKRTVAVGVRLLLPNNAPLYVYTSHLLGDTDGDRQDQVAALDQAIQRSAARDGVDWARANVIVAGDMNSSPDSPEMRYLTDRGYVDTWAAAHPDHYNDPISATACGNPYSPRFNPINLGAGMLPSQDTIGSDGRIDYVFARGSHVKVQSTTVMFTHPYGGFWMSDHYGVLTTVSFGEHVPVGDPPNPLTDSDALPPRPLTKIVEVTDQDFAPCDNEIDCDMTRPGIEVSAMSGLAFVNKSSDKMTAKLSGPGRVLPASKSSLDPGHASSFVFMQPGDYTVTIFNSVGDSLSVPLRVTGL